MLNDDICPEFLSNAITTLSSQQYLSDAQIDSLKAATALCLP